MTLAQPAAGPLRIDDERHPLGRLIALFDANTLRLLDDSLDSTESGVLAGTGAVAGVATVAFATDGRVMGGALGRAGCDRIVAAIDHAVRRGCPVVGVWHSGGARLGDGVASLNGIGGVFAAMTRASGLVPQLSLVLGAAAGGAAYGPGLTDLVVMARGARIFVTGPDVVRAATGQAVDAETLGGVEAHARSGVAHVLAEDAASAYAETRALIGLLARPGTVGAAHDPPRGPAELLPANPRRAYDVRPLLGALLDDGAWVELQAGWAANIVIGLGRLGGGTVGVVADNPCHAGGCLDAAAAEKAARFVRMCDALRVPLVVVVDVPGYLPGAEQEYGGVVRRGAKLLHAFAEATVARVTLITRKAYGGAFIAMNSRALGATAVYAWPDAEVAVMAAEAAVDIVYRRRLAAAPPDRKSVV